MVAARRRLARPRAAAALALLAAACQSKPAFFRATEWSDRSDLKGDDTLPLITDVGVDAGISCKQGLKMTGLSGGGSFIADFGMLDLPCFGRLRARAGLRYSPLYPRGGLELGFRKELRAEEKEGYALFMGIQTAGDDRRLDVLTEVGALKLFRGARAFYRFLWGAGRAFEDGAGPAWHEMGSSLGVTQLEMPPGGKGRLTVGWRTGLFDRGLESGSAEPAAASREKVRDSQRKGLKKNLLDSTPFASYGIDLNRPDQVDMAGSISWSILPEHGVLEHSLQLQSQKDSAGGRTSLRLILEQALGKRSARLRMGATYVRD